MYGSPSRSEDDLRQLVVDSGRILADQGLVDYLGHSSARIRGTDACIVKPKHSTAVHNARHLAAADMIVVDFDGEVLDGERIPPAEVFIHTAIYRARPDVNGIAHTHQAAATLMGVLEAPILPLIHVPAAMLCDRAIPRWGSPLLVTSDQRGRAMAEALGPEGRVLHLQGHGIVSVAPDLETATVQAIVLEELAERNLQVLQTGIKPHLIEPDELADLQRDMAPITGRWEYYRNRASRG